MPTYAYRCSRCKVVMSLVRKMTERNEKIYHCTLPMKRIIMAPMIAPTFKPYKAVGGDRRQINSKNEHRGFLKEFNLIEVGNDSSIAPPKIDEDAARAQSKEAEEALKQIEHAPTFSGE